MNNHAMPACTRLASNNRSAHANMQMQVSLATHNVQKSKRHNSKGTSVADAIWRPTRCTCKVATCTNALQCCFVEFSQRIVRASGVEGVGWSAQPMTPNGTGNNHRLHNGDASCKHRLHSGIIVVSGLPLGSQALGRSVWWEG